MEAMGSVADSWSVVSYRDNSARSDVSVARTVHSKIVPSGLGGTVNDKRAVSESAEETAEARVEKQDGEKASSVAHEDQAAVEAATVIEEGDDPHRGCGPARSADSEERKEDEESHASVRSERRDPSVARPSATTTCPRFRCARNGATEAVARPSATTTRPRFRCARNGATSNAASRGQAPRRRVRGFGALERRDLERREAKRHDDASEVSVRSERRDLERREAKRRDDASEVSVRSERRDLERREAKRHDDASEFRCARNGATRASRG